MPWTFAPALSVARDQRWGRAYESFGEDPALVTSMTTAISGLQGGGLSLPDTVLATAKHFVGDGGAVWGTGNNPGGTPIDRGDDQMSDAALRAIHLAPVHERDHARRRLGDGLVQQRQRPEDARQPAAA